MRVRKAHILHAGPRPVGRWVALASVLLSPVVAAGAYCALATRWYASETTLQIRLADESAGDATVRRATATAVIDQPAVVVSDAVLARALRKLAGKPDLNGPASRSAGRQGANAPPEEAGEIHLLRSRLSPSVPHGRGESSFLMKLRLDWPEVSGQTGASERANRMLAAVAEAYCGYLAGQDGAQQSPQVAAERAELATRQEAFGRAQQALEDFRQSQGRDFAATTCESADRILFDSLGDRLAELRAAMEVLDRELAKPADQEVVAPEMARRQIPAFDELAKRLTEIRLHLNILRPRADEYGQQIPALEQERLETLRSLREELGKYRTALAQELAVKKARREALEGRLRLAQWHAELTAQVEGARQELQRQRLRTQAAQDNARAAWVPLSATVLAQPACVDDGGPCRPRLWTNLGLALALGMLLAGGHEWAVRRRARAPGR